MGLEPREDGGNVGLSISRVAATAPQSTALIGGYLGRVHIFTARCLRVCENERPQISQGESEALSVHSTSLVDGQADV